MKKKCRAVLGSLLEERDFVAAQDLADSLGLSRRSLMRALDELDECLAGIGACPTERVPNRGIRIAPEGLERARELFAQDSDAQAALDLTSAADRRFFLLFCFMCLDGGCTTETLAEWMGASARTVSNDIRALRRALGEQNLGLAYDKKRGYRLQGNLFTVRNLFIKKLAELCPAGTAREAAGALAALYALAGGARAPIEAGRLVDVSQMVSAILPNHYEAAARRTIVMQVAVIAISRVGDCAFGFTEADRSYLEKGVGFDLARYIRVKSSETLGVEIAAEEDYYLGMLLQSLPAAAASGARTNYPFEIEVAVQKLILMVGERFQFDFSVDEELFGVIVGHAIPLVYRALFGCQITNPLLPEIVTKYGRLHEAVRDSVGVIEEFAGTRISDDECSFVTLYFASSIEKLANAGAGRMRVAVVCNAGNAVSRLLQYKLVNAFNVDVAAALSERELYGLLEDGDGLDLVIGVVDVDQARLGGVPFVRVSPLLSDQDLQTLSKYLGRRVFMKKDAEQEGLGLLDLLRPECFALKDGVAGMDELILAGGELLREAGLCDDEYPRQMVSAAHCFGPLTTILIAPGIIMPHAGISEHVFKTGFSFVKLREPVAVNGKKVTCALSLCTRNKKINQRAIQQVGILLSRTSFMDRVNQVGSYDELAELVNQCLAEAERK